MKYPKLIDWFRKIYSTIVVKYEKICTNPANGLRNSNNKTTDGGSGGGGQVKGGGSVRGSIARVNSKTAPARLEGFDEEEDEENLLFKVIFCPNNLYFLSVPSMENLCQDLWPSDVTYCEFTLQLICTFKIMRGASSL